MTTVCSTPAGVLLASGIAVMLYAASALGQSCAMCGSSFGENDPMSRAFSWSILFLMATPYAIIGSIGAYLVYMYRRAPRRPPGAIIPLVRSAGRLGRPMPADGGEGDIA